MKILRLGLVLALVLTVNLWSNLKANSKLSQSILVENSPAETLLEAEEGHDSRRFTGGQLKPEWTVMVYIQARNNLGPFAASNLQDAAAAMDGNRVVMLAQWDQTHRNGAWRYKVNKRDIALENYSEVKDPRNCQQNLVDFVRWSVKHHPAHRYALVLWNHGMGAVEPSYGDPLRLFVQDNRDLAENPRINLAGIMEECVKEHDKLVVQSLNTVQLSPDFNLSHEHQSVEHKDRRGVLYDEDNRCFLSNKGLKDALAEIAGPQILGRKLDCIGFDACFMGGMEIAYQVREYADYMIASEELEMARGWNYYSIISKLCAGNVTPAQLGQEVVSSFEALYRGKTPFCTQSCVDLSRMDEVVNNLNAVLQHLEPCLKNHGSALGQAICKARKASLQFSAKFYIDLHSFYSQFLQHLLNEPGIIPSDLVGQKVNFATCDLGNLKQRGFSDEVLVLVAKLRAALSSLEQAIVANATSPQLAPAKGLSIYFPNSSLVDPSYSTNDFAANSYWLEFIRASSQCLFGIHNPF